MSGVRLTFDTVSCVRGDRLLFKDLSFDLSAGAAALVTGPNGAGKSSLIRIAAGLLGASTGSVAREGQMALAQELPALDPGKSVFDMLLYWARIDGGTNDAVLQALKAMGMAGLAEVPVRLLSTGQRKRVTLARVLASGAAIWVLDEPGNGLDSAALELLTSAIAKHRAFGGIVMAATHQPIGLDDAIGIALGQPLDALS